MMKKGELLLYYDTGKPLEQRDEITKKYGLLDETDDHTIQDYGWMLFKDNLTQLIKDKNPENNWESNDFPGSYIVGHYIEPQGSDEEMLKFKLKDGHDLLHKFSLHAFPDFFGDWKINIYAYGNDGLYVESRQDWKNENTKVFESVSLLLRACKTGFHRDWERDGVCVQNTKRLLSTSERANLTEFAEEKLHSRAMKRNVEDAEGGW